MNDKYRVPDAPMEACLRLFADHLSRCMKEFSPDFVAPILAKGAILLETIQDARGLTFTAKTIYPRGFKFLPPDVVAKSKFLVVGVSKAPWSR